MGTNFWAKYVKFFGHDGIEFKDGTVVLKLPNDPQVVAVDAPQSSFGAFGSNLYVKTDAGSTINWKLLADDAALQAHISSGTAHAAASITYDNTTSGLTATDSQAAIDEVEGRVDNAEVRLRNLLGSGLLSGGDMSVVNSTDIQVLAGKGVITDDTDPDNPTYTEVTWVTQNFTVTTTGNVQYIYIDNAGAIKEQATDFTAQDSRDKIILGPVNTIGGQVNTATNIVVPQIDVSNLVCDLSKSIGIINKKGNTVGPNVLLQLSKTSGEVHELGANYVNNKKDPSTISNPQFDTSVVAKYLTEFYSDGVGGVSFTAPSSSVDPTKWDDGSGTLQNVGNNNWSVKKIYLAPISNTFFVTYGAEEYNALNVAKQRFQSEVSVLPDSPTQLLLLGYLFVRGGATDLNLDGDALFLQANKFGSGVGAGASGIDNNLQETYENSPNGDTVLDSTRGVLAVRDNVVPLGTNLHEVTDNADSVKYHEVSAVRTAVTDRDGTNVLRKDVDVMTIEDFKVNDPTTVITVTGSWTLANETAASEKISGFQSASLTQVPASLGATAEILSKPLDNKALGLLMGLFSEFKYSGNANEIQLDVLQSDDDVTYDVLESMTLSQATKTTVSKLLHKFRSTATHTGIRLTVIKLNNTAKLIIDNIRWEYNPTPTAEFVETNSVMLEGNDGRAITANTEDVQFNGSGNGWFSSGDDHHYKVQNSNSQVELSVGVHLASNQAFRILLYKNDVYYKNLTMRPDLASPASFNAATYISSVGEFVKDDELSIRIDPGATLFNSTEFHYLNIVEERKSTNVLFKGQSGGNTQEYILPSNISTNTSVTTFPTEVGVEYEVSGKIRVSRNSNEIDVRFESGGTIEHETVSTGPSPNSSTQDLSFKFTAKGTTLNVTTTNATGAVLLGAGDKTRDGSYIQLTPTETFNSTPITDQVVNKYSATIPSSGTTAVSDLGFVESISWAGNIVTINMKAGFWGGETPRVVGLVPKFTGTLRRADVTAISDTQIIVVMENSAAEFDIELQRTGSDYRAPQGHFIGNMPLSSGDLAGTEYWTGRKLGGRKVMARTWRTTVNHVANVTIDTIPTGLEPVGIINGAANIWYIDQLAFDGTNITYVRYNDSTGAVDFFFTTGNPPINSGYIFTLEYLE